MTGMIRKATLLVVLGLVAATSAMAGIPSAANCTVPAFIDVVGTNGVVPDPYGAYTVVVRDIGNFPVPNVAVVIDFVGASDIRLCTNLVPVGQTNTCNTASVLTDINGSATFRVAGAAKNNGGLATGGGLGAIVVRAAGWTIGAVTATAFDENGANGVQPGCDVTDLSAWLTDSGLFGGLGNPAYKGRSDYNHNGQIDVIDLSYFLTVQGIGASSVGCTYCP